jgi:hypothetical protein
VKESEEADSHEADKLKCTFATEFTESTEKKIVNRES